MRGFQLALGTVPLALAGKYMSCWKTGPFKWYHDQTSILYFRVLAEEPNESGGTGAKVGDNTVHKIVPPIWWIFFTSVSTYFQNHSSGCPSCNPQNIRVRASQVDSNRPLFSHRVDIVSQCWRLLRQYHGNQLVWNIQTYGIPSNLGPPALHMIM